MGLEHAEGEFCCGACKEASTTPAESNAAPEALSSHFAVAPDGRPVGALLRDQGGRTFPLSAARVVVGRGRTADVVIEDAALSRQQFELVFTPADVRIADLGSSCGTYVNGRKAAHRQVLREGDRILVGDTVLWLVAG